MSKYHSFIKLIPKYFHIVNKNQEVVDFTPNKAQTDFIENMSEKNIILKARQLGFSSVILAMLTLRFLFKKNQRCVVVSHETGATQKLMDRVKFYIQSFEQKFKIKTPLKYNSRSEMVNEAMNSSFYIGTAGSRAFGRGDTITTLHLSEFAFYTDPESILSGVLQALVPNGLLFIETTSNGFNFFKTLWDEAEERGFKKHFYNPTWEYPEEFLTKKRKELGRLFSQEYPFTEEESFLTSGDTYFSKESLKWYNERTKQPISFNLL